jgi:hypothetical protein
MSQESVNWSALELKNVYNEMRNKERKLRAAEGCQLFIATRCGNVRARRYSASDLLCFSNLLLILCYWDYRTVIVVNWGFAYFNPQTTELNPSAQRYLTRFFTVDFASWTVYFVNICVKNQQLQYNNYWFSLLIIYGISYMFRHYIAILKERS